MISTEDNTSPQKHQKHAKLTRPAFGNFGRNEWAIVGGQCAVIKEIAAKVIAALSPDYKCAYVDSSHSNDILILPGQLANGAVLDYTDQIDYIQLDYSSSFNSFKLKETFGFADLVIANGNHHQAKAQMVIIDQSKKASLQKRLAELTNVEMILLADDQVEVFDFIKENVPGWAVLPLYKVNETEKIITFFKNKLQVAKPKLNGMVLTGGESRRMGFDKGTVNWHGQEQRYHLADMLAGFCEDVYLSCRPDQRSEIGDGYLALPDTFTGLGPYGGLLSAFREHPDRAWLVVACDLPLLSDKTLAYLVDHRNSATVATAFQSSFNDFPEPLITIWEPKSYPVLLSFLSQGYSCPRKVLINSDVTVLNAPNPEELTNVNTPEEFQKIKELLAHKVTV